MPTRYVDRADRGYCAARRGLVYVPGAGRYLYDTDDFYETPVYIRAYGQVSTDVP